MESIYRVDMEKFAYMEEAVGLLSSIQKKYYLILKLWNTEVETYMSLNLVSFVANMTVKSVRCGSSTYWTNMYRQVRQLN